MSETGYDVLTSAETKEKLGDITFITAELSGKEITANKKRDASASRFSDVLSGK